MRARRPLAWRSARSRTSSVAAGSTIGLASRGSATTRASGSACRRVRSRVWHRSRRRSDVCRRLRRSSRGASCRGRMLACWRPWLPRRLTPIYGAIKTGKSVRPRPIRMHPPSASRSDLRARWLALRGARLQRASESPRPPRPLSLPRRRQPPHQSPHGLRLAPSARDSLRPGSRLGHGAPRHPLATRHHERRCRCAARFARRPLPRRRRGHGRSPDPPAPHGDPPGDLDPTRWRLGGDTTSGATLPSPGRPDTRLLGSRDETALYIFPEGLVDARAMPDGDHAEYTA